MASKLIKNLQKFKLVTFDLTDTLIKFKRHPGIEYASTATSLGYKNIDPEKISAQFASNFKQMNSDYPNFGRNKMSWEKWWETLIGKIFKSAGITLTDNDIYLISNELIDKYETDECWEFQDGAVELIEKIKDSDKIVGIISNYDPRLKFLVENMKLPELDFVVGSYEAGAAKPDPLIFNLATKLTNFNAMPWESLHVGNTPTLDYIAAKEAEWTSVLITNGKKDWLVHKEKINENHAFNSLSEFLMKLENDDIDWGELHDITFQMDIADRTAPGYDANCIPLTNPGGLTEDYIIIPKASVSGPQPLRASMFCSNTTTGLEITSTARGPFVIEVNTDTKTTPNMETGFQFRYKIV